MISIIIPTVDGREQHLRRCLDAYEQHTPELHELIVLRNRPTCGQAWNDGAELAAGEFLHFTADDLEPHAGWARPAVEAVKRGCLPAPLLDQGRGVTSCGEHWHVSVEDWQEVDVTGVPFLGRDQWKLIGPVFPGHYFTDNYISHKGREHGFRTVARLAYRLAHHWAQEGRGAGMTERERMNVDREAFETLIR